MGVSANANYLKRIFMHPCATPDIKILVETALPAAAITLWQLVAIGCTDIVKMRIGKSPWHVRKMNALIKGGAGMVPAGTNSFLGAIGYDVIERGLWYWLVADAVSGFIPHWMSMIYQETKCDEPGRGYIETTLAVGFCGPGTYNEVPAGGVDSIGCARFDGVGVTITAGCYCTITFDVAPVDFHPEIFGHGRAEFFLYDDLGNNTELKGIDLGNPHHPVSIAGGMQRSTNTFATDRKVKVVMHVTTGVVAVPVGHIQVSAYGLPYHFLNAGCNPKPPAYQIPWPHG